MSLRRTLAIPALLAVTILAGVYLPAESATVPPRNCGPLTVGSRHFIIKADQIRCTTAKTDAKAYLVSRRKPSG